MASPITRCKISSRQLRIILKVASSSCPCKRTEGLKVPGCILMSMRIDNDDDEVNDDGWPEI